MHRKYLEIYVRLLSWFRMKYRFGKIIEVHNSYKDGVQARGVTLDLVTNTFIEFLNPRIENNLYTHKNTRERKFI